MLDLISSAGRSRYLTPISFAENIVDWSLEDRGLLRLRSRGGQFARTLMPIAREFQLLWEYLNYALALAGLAVVYVVRRHSRRRSAERYVRTLQLQGV